MYNGEITEANLAIGGFYSRCGACGKNADPNEAHHTMARMRGEGCGAKFVSTTSDYGDEAACKRLQPNLPYIGSTANPDSWEWLGTNR